MRVVVITQDPLLADEVGRLAAAAGVTPDVAGPAEALAAWSSAGVVLLGVDMLAHLHGVQPPRREAVHVVGVGEQEREVFAAAVGVGAHSVAELPASQAWLVELLTDVDSPPSRGRTVGVIGGTGGAGASTLACALAQVGAQRGPTLLIDADPLGSGADRMLGLETEEGVRWSEIVRAPGRLGARALRESLPRVRDLGVLTWGPGERPDVDTGAAREALAAARRGHDLVVVDPGRRLTPASLELLGRCDHLLVVTPATVAGLASTVRVLGGLGHLVGRASVVLRPGPVPREDVEETTGCRVSALLRDQRGITESVDLGLGPVRSHRSASARVATEILAWVS
ncbi:MAG: septum site-determining protein Ssd [Nocardioides sp.]|uniref:septum site-determining protein Ssd n=1 Tax=Nocardioides sp. TaxID=35761 RepID=UPI003F0DD023